MHFNEKKFAVFLCIEYKIQIELNSIKLNLYVKYLVGQCRCFKRFSGDISLKKFDDRSFEN